MTKALRKVGFLCILLHSNYTVWESCCQINYTRQFNGLLILKIQHKEVDIFRCYVLAFLSEHVFTNIPWSVENMKLKNGPDLFTIRAHNVEETKTFSENTGNFFEIFIYNFRSCFNVYMLICALKMILIGLLIHRQLKIRF